MRARITGVVTLLVTTVSLITVGAPANAVTLAHCRGVQLVAHRGMVDRTATENTIHAFVHAYQRSARNLETDLQLTEDHQWVLMHDATINRTTNGTGTVASKTVPQLKRYRTNDGVVGGIPRLAQALAFLKVRPRARMQFEIKPVTVDDADITKIINLANSYGVRPRVSIISFATGPLSAVRRLDPGLRTGLLTRGRLTATSVRRYASTVHVARAAITPGYIAYMHRYGISVNTFVVDKRPLWGRAVRVGVDSITTNAVPYLRRFCVTRP